jgi:hypothetical protein
MSDSDTFERFKALLENNQTIVVCGPRGIGKARTLKTYCERLRLIYPEISWYPELPGSQNSILFTESCLSDLSLEQVRNKLPKRTKLIWITATRPHPSLYRSLNLSELCWKGMDSLEFHNALNAQLKSREKRSLSETQSELIQQACASHHFYLYEFCHLMLDKGYSLNRLLDHSSHFYSLRNQLFSEFYLQPLDPNEMKALYYLSLLKHPLNPEAVIEPKWLEIFQNLYQKCYVNTGDKGAFELHPVIRNCLQTYVEKSENLINDFLSIINPESASFELFPDILEIKALLLKPDNLYHEIESVYQLLVYHRVSAKELLTLLQHCQKHCQPILKEFAFALICDMHTSGSRLNSWLKEHPFELKEPGPSHYVNGLHEMENLRFAKATKEFRLAKKHPLPNILQIHCRMYIHRFSSNESRILEIEEELFHMTDPAKQGYYHQYLAGYYKDINEITKALNHVDAAFNIYSGGYHPEASAILSELKATCLYLGDRTYEASVFLKKNLPYLAHLSPERYCNCLLILARCQESEEQYFEASRTVEMIFKKQSNLSFELISLCSVFIVYLRCAAGLSLSIDDEVLLHRAKMGINSSTSHPYSRTALSLLFKYCLLSHSLEDAAYYEKIITAIESEGVFPDTALIHIYFYRMLYFQLIDEKKRSQECRSRYIKLLACLPLRTQNVLKENNDKFYKLLPHKPDIFKTITSGASAPVPEEPVSEQENPELFIDFSRKVITVNEVEIPLFRKKRLCELLKIYCENPGTYLRGEDVFQRVWKKTFRPILDSDTLRISIYRINKLLPTSQPVLQTGEIKNTYRLNPDLKYRLIVASTLS